jgi:hypothetical protein
MRSYLRFLWESAGMFLGAKIGRLPKEVILMGWLLAVVLTLRKMLESRRWSFNFLEYSF